MHLRCCSYMLPLLFFVRTGDEHAFFICSYKNVFYKVNTSLACLMNMGGDRQELAHVCTKLCSLPAFLCSFVLVSLFIALSSLVYG